MLKPHFLQRRHFIRSKVSQGYQQHAAQFGRIHMIGARGNHYSTKLDLSVRVFFPRQFQRLTKLLAF